jgi:hypothetical protein
MKKVGIETWSHLPRTRSWAVAELGPGVPEPVRTKARPDNQLCQCGDTSWSADSPMCHGNLPFSQACCENSEGVSSTVPHGHSEYEENSITGPWLDCLHPPQVQMLNSYSQSDGVRRWGLWEWLGQEGGSVINGISDLIKTHKSLLSLCSLPWEDTARRQPSLDTRSVGILNLDIPASRTSRNKCYLSHPAHGVCMCLFFEMGVSL